jgi:hypothetical protein
MIVQKDRAQVATVRKVAELLADVIASHGNELAGML